jgi:methylmalonyl-CoA mutase C-terminal domain/subunit
MAVLGMDQHENGSIAASGVLRDAGMEVIYLGRFQLPHHIVRAAIDEGVDVIGVSVHSWEYRALIPALLEKLKEEGVRTPVAVGGSILTPADEEELVRTGVAATFGPASDPGTIVERIRAIVAP